jgi:hypothetical protein
MHFVLAFILWCPLLFKDPKELNLKNQTENFSKGIRQNLIRLLDWVSIKDPGIIPTLSIIQTLAPSSEPLILKFQILRPNYSSE